MTPAEMVATRVAVAERFIQSAIIIDDQAEIMPSFPVVSAKVAIKASGSLLERAAMPAADVVLPAEAEPAGDARLDAKALTDAFLAKSVICGVFRPSSDENPAQICAQAADHADIVIVDWFLEAGSSQKAKETIRTLLKADARQRERLRLIVVYTSNPGRALMALELHEFVEADAETQGRLQVSAVGVLTGVSTRIIFINKAGTPGGGDAEPLEEQLLPARVIEEFANLAEGLLPNFAVRSIAMIREATPRLLALFNSELDGAYVAHRCALKDPEDAEQFATELVANELRGVLETGGIAEQLLGIETIIAWIDAFGPQHQFSDHDTVLAPPDIVKKMAREGAEVFKGNVFKKIAQPDSASAKKIKADRAASMFYPDEASARAGNQRLARLSMFRNEGYPGAPVPPDWRPYLTLGSVLKPLPTKRGAPVTEGFVVCIQPRCDSVRLEVATSFPFQLAAASIGHFNMVVKHGDPIGTELVVSTKPRDAVLVKFKPDAASQRVVAIFDAPSKTFVFKDIRGRKYQWVGDLKEMKAQSFASDVGSRVHGVGLDELEWMRNSKDPN